MFLWCKLSHWLKTFYRDKGQTRSSQQPQVPFTESPHKYSSYLSTWTIDTNWLNIFITKVMFRAATRQWQNPRNFIYFRKFCSWKKKKFNLNFFFFFKSAEFPRIRRRVAALNVATKLRLYNWDIETASLNLAITKTNNDIKGEKKVTLGNLLGFFVCQKLTTQYKRF